MSSSNNRLDKPILIHRRRRAAATGRVMRRRFFNNDAQRRAYLKRQAEATKTDTGHRTPDTGHAKGTGQAKGAP